MPINILGLALIILSIVLFILELNITVHGESTKKYIEGIFLEHPRREEVLWLYIEENNTGKIVSGLTLSPLDWKIGDLSF